jgi:hypothetical protein
MGTREERCGRGKVPKNVPHRALTYPTAVTVLTHPSNRNIASAETRVREGMTTETRVSCVSHSEGRLMRREPNRVFRQEEFREEFFLKISLSSLEFAPRPRSRS